jgi:hypothetical protein
MKRLSLNIFIKDFKSTSSNFFRAHPTFIQCLQKVFSDLASQSYKVSVYLWYCHICFAFDGFTLYSLTWKWGLISRLV